MAATHIFFAVVYLIIFVLYANSYTGTMQTINEDFKLLKVKGIKVQKVQRRLAINQRKVAEMKKTIWIPTLILIVLHFVCVLTTRTTIVEILIALGVSASFCALLLLTNWMKGAGTIDDQNRFRKSPWM